MYVHAGCLQVVRLPPLRCLRVHTALGLLLNEAICQQIRLCTVFEVTQRLPALLLCSIRRSVQ
jgi:hypothetical protein